MGPFQEIFWGFNTGKDGGLSNDNWVKNQFAGCELYFVSCPWSVPVECVSSRLNDLLEFNSAILYVNDPESLINGVNIPRDKLWGVSWVLHIVCGKLCFVYCFND